MQQSKRLKQKCSWVDRTNNVRACMYVNGNERPLIRSLSRYVACDQQSSGERELIASRLALIINKCIV